MGSESAAVPSSRQSGRVGEGLRLYWEVARRGYRRYATYRGATVAGAFTNTVFGFMRCYVLIALFTSRPLIGGYTVADGLTYTWLSQGSIMIVYVWGWYEIAERVRSGDIISDFQRPIDFQAYWLAQDLGRALYHGLFRGIPPFILGALFFHLFIPRDPITYLLFVLSLILAVGVSFGLRFMVNIAAFWLLDYRGIGTLAQVLWTFLAGFIVPLAIFPPVARAIIEVLPFAGMIQTPVDIFLEKYHGWDLVSVLALQLGWVIVLLAVGRWLLTVATRKLVVQGG